MRFPPVLCLALLSLFIPDVSAQTTAPPAELVTVLGSIVDPSGGAVSKAAIAVQDPSRRTIASGLTDSRGGFEIRLPPGTYQLEISATGFEPWKDEWVVAGQQAPRRIVLEVAGLRESVTVQGRRPTVNSTKTPSLPLDIPQSVTIVPKELMRDQSMSSIADVVRYIPGISAHQGENNRDDVVIRGNRSSADFFVNGIRDDVQYYRDLYNVERVEALKGPNALLFGRGGGGGVVNRVLKEPQFQPFRGISLQGGAFENGRVTADLEQPVGNVLAMRLNSMLQRSESFRSHVSLRREAINPTLTVNAGARTKVTAAYEFLRDRRTADRGITSFQGRPATIQPSTFYGDPAESHVGAKAQLGSVAVDHQLGAARLRNRTLVAGYDRFYQNFVPGTASADAATVALTAYNNATTRDNVFNQTDIVVPVRTGGIDHTLLTGVELGRQRTDNFRQTGFFPGGVTAFRVAFDRPTVSVPVSFRQSATDADNHIQTRIAAAFLQDEIRISRRVRLVAGARVDRFELEYRNRRTGESLSRADDLFSPRAGVIIKPLETLSLYGSYSRSHLPSSGDQFSSLTVITQQMKPERFDNFEVGSKWGLRRRVSLTGAIYRLDRTNTRSTDPNDVTRIVQTGSQRTSGVEVGIDGEITGKWTVNGGYAHQNARVVSATAAAAAGARAGQVPRHTVSLWNRYQLTHRVGAAVGFTYRSQMFATIDNTVVLPGYTRADAAAFVTLTSRLSLQANIENVFNTTYFLNADSNTNISPGAPRSLRVGLNARF